MQHLKQLNIENYRLFEKLEIPNLAQINLIGGRNNMGKTALLEAIRLWGSNGSSSLIRIILANRDDIYANEKDTLETLFYDALKKEKEPSIKINDLNIQARCDDYGRWDLNIDNRSFNIRTDSIQDEHIPLVSIREKLVYIPSSISYNNLRLWSAIDLTPKKAAVIEALKVIDPKVKDLGIYGEKSAKVLIEGESKPTPLKRLGDGINRILSIALALVTAEDNILLIDEFETGLHYTVQYKLWDLIFKLAKELNVQVIATTHSNDCIATFAEIAQKKANMNVSTQYFRLDRDKNGTIVPIMYEQDTLDIALEQNIEMR